MEGVAASEHIAIVRRDDDRQSIRDGIGVDEEWEHYRFPKEQRHKSIGTCTSCLSLLFIRDRRFRNFRSSQGSRRGWSTCMIREWSMGTSMEYVFQPYIDQLCQLMTSQAEHHDRRQWPGSHSRPQYDHASLQPIDLSIVMHRHRHGSMDEPRTTQPGEI